MHDINMIWEDYERYLKYLRELEKKNSELGKKIQIDTMRIDFLQKEGECKQIYKYKGVNENEEESLSRITELNTFLSFLSMKLDEIEELLDVDSTSIDQVKELIKQLLNLIYAIQNIPEIIIQHHKIII